MQWWTAQEPGRRFNPAVIQNTRKATDTAWPNPSPWCVEARATAAGAAVLSCSCCCPSLSLTVPFFSIIVAACGTVSDSWWGSRVHCCYCFECWRKAIICLVYYQILLSWSLPCPLPHHQTLEHAELDQISSISTDGRPWHRVTVAISKTCWGGLCTGSSASRNGSTAVSQDKLKCLFGCASMMSTNMNAMSFCPAAFLCICPAASHLPCCLTSLHMPVQSQSMVVLHADLAHSFMLVTLHACEWILLYIFFKSWLRTRLCVYPQLPIVNNMESNICIQILRMEAGGKFQLSCFESCWIFFSVFE